MKLMSTPQCMQHIVLEFLHHVTYMLHSIQTVTETHLQ